MGIFKRERAVEIIAASGVVRITVNPMPASATLLVQVAVIGLFGVVAASTWAAMTLIFRAVVVWAIASSIAALCYQLSGSEVIEFSEQRLLITKSNLGWSRIREYATADCQCLEVREPSGEGDNSRLQCKVGWKTVRFGDYLSQDEGIEVIAELQANLPQVAQQMLAMSSTKGDLTILNLH